MGGFGIPGPLQVATIRLHIQFRKLLAEVILQSLCGVFRSTSSGFRSSQGYEGDSTIQKF